MIVALALAAACAVSGDPARWYAEVCPKKDCPRPKFDDACAEAKFWKKKWCEGYVKAGGQTTAPECVDDRALIPAGVDEQIGERDVKVDGKPCKQSVTYFATGKHRESRITCAGKRDGIYERWAENGARYIQGGFKDDQPFGLWNVYGPDNRLKFKVAYANGAVSERGPALVPGKDGAFELYAADAAAKDALRIEADGKLTYLAGGKRAEAYLDDEAYASAQALLQKIFAGGSCDAKGPATAYAVRHAGEVRRMTCTSPDLAALGKLTAQLRQPGTVSGDVLGVVGVASDESAGELDFPKSKAR
jgi:hypothetical protein